MPDAVRGEIRELVLSGASWLAVAAACQVSRSTVARVMRETGGMPARAGMVRDAGAMPRVSRCRSARWLSLAEREEIRAGLAAGVSLAEIGRRLGRAASTVTRAVVGEGGRGRYLAWVAERRAGEGRRRPKPGEVAVARVL